MDELSPGISEALPPETRVPEIRVDVCVCTYRRRSLEATLVSIGAQVLPGHVKVSIIVADNDSVPSAAALVEEVAARLPFPVRYVHSPQSNISIARNSCLDAATGDYVAFIDDDETATPHWLALLVETAERSGADVVLGPVRALYDDQAPGWMRRAGVHDTFPVHVGGEIRTGYTCNALLRRSAPAIAGRRFELALGRSGGEDTQLFTEVYEAGGRFAYAAEARVEEPVPPERARFSWLAKRRFRSGQTHGWLLRRKAAGAAGVARGIAVAAAKVTYCFAVALVFAFSPVRRNRSLLRGTMHVGVITGLAGVRQITQYGGNAALTPQGSNANGF